MANQVATLTNSIKQAWRIGAAAVAVKVEAKKFFLAGLTFCKSAVFCAAFNQELHEEKQSQLFFPVRFEIFPPKGVAPFLRWDFFSPYHGGGVRADLESRVAVPVTVP